MTKGSLNDRSQPSAPRASAEAVGSLLADAPPDWDEKTLPAVWQHLLDSATHYWVRSGQFRHDIPVETLGECLSSNKVTRRGLTRLAAIIEAARQNETAPLPVKPARMLLTLLACRMLIRHQSPLESYPFAKLRQEIEWARAQDWIDPSARRLLDDAEAADKQAKPAPSSESNPGTK